MLSEKDLPFIYDTKGQPVNWGPFRGRLLYSTDVSRVGTKREQLKILKRI